MNIRIAIADQNETYLERLGEGLQKYKNLSCTRYSDSAAFLRALSARKFDVVLFDTSMLEDSGYQTADFSNTALPIVLYHEDTDLRFLPPDIEKIDKYQRISQIYRNLADLYALIGEGRAEAGNRASLIAVYSPAGGTGKTVVSWKLAQQISAAGGQVLYLNMEEIPSFAAFARPGEQGGLDELYTFALQRSGDIKLKLEACVQEISHGLYTMNPFGNLMDIGGLTESDVEELLEKIVSSGKFTHVIVDMSSSLSGKNRQILTKAGFIVLVEKPDRCTQAKMQRLLGQYNLMEDYAYKMVRVQNFDIGRPQLWSDCQIPVVGKIPFCGSMGDDNMLAFVSQFNPLDLNRILQNS